MIGNKNKGDEKMRINSPKMKQIKKGVYILTQGGDLEVADYHYSLPHNSVIVPEKNIVFIFLHKGTYAWQYSSSSDTWRSWKISSKKAEKIILQDAINDIKTKMFDMIVEKNEGNKAFVLIPSKIDGKTVMTTEWRYYTYFFRDIIRRTR